MEGSELQPELVAKIPARDSTTLAFLLAYLEERNWLPTVQAMRMQ